MCLWTVLVLILLSGLMYHVFHNGKQKESKKFNLKLAPHGSSGEISIKFIKRCFSLVFFLIVYTVCSPKSELTHI